MNIQKTNNVNFEARRIINVRKALQNGADEVIDVFVLGKEDKKFIARCNAALNADDRVVINTRNNIKRASESADTSFRNFFKNFLRRFAGRQHDGIRFDDVTYMVAIKDGETMTGIAEVRDDCYPASFMERLIFKDYDNTARNGLMYAVISAMKDQKSSAIIGIGNLLPKQKNAAVRKESFNSALASLRASTPDAKFEKVRDSHQYDLEEFLGIKDIETEIMD